MIPVIVVFAPTACGKTALAEELFGRSSSFVFKGMAEAISADSQAVYRGLDIGTAKPTQEERRELPFHLIDVCDPFVQFGLGNFLEAADSLCAQIWAGKKVPLVIGGTGFYIRNFLLGPPSTPESRPEVRADIQHRLSSLGKEKLYAELCRIDPVSAEKINVNDEYRICRALEIFYSCGKPLSSFEIPSELRSQYDFCTLILNRNRKELYERIDSRVEKMFADGLADEVEQLKCRGLTKDSPAMKAIGYKEFFYENFSLEEVKQKIKSDSHRYAKKQYTFMRGIPGALVIDADDREAIKKIISEFLSTRLL
ncbi:tRNA (adenosine(37)-N6)-dimethylallyltransferase MiaA [Treponema sp.]|uniref:tRNA (adenosine(37)-N6)-dimethylallyltransferase MiaA n=1 Tax=Treponema sp. TaxID=166 RepID=UPI003F09FD25